LIESNYNFVALIWTCGIWKR